DPGGARHCCLLDFRRRLDARRGSPAAAQPATVPPDAQRMVRAVRAPDRRAPYHAERSGCAPVATVAPRLALQRIGRANRPNWPQSYSRRTATAADAARPHYRRSNGDTLLRPPIPTWAWQANE